MTNSYLETILDEKLNESYEQIARQKRRSKLASIIEFGLLTLAITLFTLFMKFVFWGEGFRYFLPETHDSVVSALTEAEGPQREQIKETMAKEGYLSLVDYGTYVEVANEFEARKVASE